MSSEAFTITQFVLDTGPEHAIMKATAKRYIPKNVARYVNDSGYILMFTHGTGFLKELWEPIIERLFMNDQPNREANRSSKILECWAIDCQTHGAAAPLNDEILLRRPGILDIHFYADAIIKLYESGLLGVIDNEVQKVALIGHSAGAIASVLAAATFGTPGDNPFSMLILVDPPLFTSETKNKMTPMYRIVEKTNRKRISTWKSKDDAREFFKSAPPYSGWDPRSLSIFLEHGLRPLPTPFLPDKTGVTLMCKPSDEGAGFDNIHHSVEALNHLGNICATIPVHFAFGARNDMFSREVQDAMYDSSAGRNAASVVRIKGAGHLVVQEQPEKLADALYKMFNNVGAKL
ncbi:Alpha/Beta hydrolase protein [Flammula alnicola]|nr:Alpha/Beta hydrolase protein [Flammula alnicola]